MKFFKNWKKLDYPIFTTIRQDKGYYKVGQVIKVNSPNEYFSAEVVAIREMCLEDITDTMALRDADCSKKELKDLLYKFYKDKTDELILITLMKL